MTQPIELSVRFTAEEGDPVIRVNLFRPDNGTSTQPQPWTPPLTDADLADLRWYLEVFSLWPTGPDYVRAEGIKSKLEGWGRALRDSVLTSPEANRLWQQFLDAPAPAQNGEGGKLLTLDATDPSVLRLPWELLADNHGHLFAQGIGVRRRLQEATRLPGASVAALPVRVLVVMARPEGAGFIDPRAISKPLLDALESLGDQVDVEFLYPPTLAALDRRLHDRAAPQVHVVHFDGHGVYDTRKGLGYLLFENEKHGQDLVDADRLGTLLVNTHVPLMALNACQSAAQQEADPYASVAARLIRAGVGSVLAMNYSVLVEAARRFVGEFYTGLAQGQSVGRAVDQGRRALLADEGRHTLTRRNDQGELVDETVQLRDWFLPALYQQAADPVLFAGHGPTAPAARPRPRPTALTTPTSPGGLPASPNHGFHGRAREMLKLERAFARRAVVVVHGFGGQGKTALAGEAGRWFTRTGRFPGGAAFVSFEHGGSLEQLCSWVGQAVSGDPDFMIHGEADDGGPVERVAALLRERPALVILDNFESVLGRAPLMPAAELAAILDAVWLWAGGDGRGQSPTRPSAPGHPCILITTRDTSFPDARFAPGRACAHLPLGGLAEVDALALAGAILDDRSIDRANVPRQDLVDLMARLGGHPLSLNLVLPQLATYTPAQLSARFEELLPGFTQGKAAERNESLALSLDFSLRRLGEESRAALPDLAVFQGAAFEDTCWPSPRSTRPCGGPPARRWSRPPWSPWSRCPASAALPALPPHPAARPGRPPGPGPPGRPDRTLLAALLRLGDYLYQADNTTPHQARAIALRELPNLAHAFDLAHAVLDRTTDPQAQADLLLTVVQFADRLSRFLNAFGRWRERDALQGRVQALQSRLTGDGPLTKAGFTMLVKEGEALLAQGRAGDAERIFRTLLARLEAGTAYGDTTYDQGLTLLWLGRCLESQGKPAAAVPVHRQALARFQSIAGENEQAKRMVGAAHTELADLFQALGQYDQSRLEYEAALEIDEELGDLRGKGVDLGQLGTLALEQNDLAEARRRYVDALATFQALGEPQTEAVFWHQLGMVAEEARAWDEAERCYRESLGIKERNKDLPGVARTCNQLAIVAKGAGRLDDAERWYLRTIELCEQTQVHPKNWAKVATATWPTST